jgi:hypothetical protein
VAGCVAFAFLATGNSAGEAPAAPQPTAIDRYRADSLDAIRIPGMAVAIIRGGEVMHMAGYGTDGRASPVSPRTPFRIGSLTKSFTAAAVLQLAASGRIALDAPVQAYLRDFATADPNLPGKAETGLCICRRAIGAVRYSIGPCFWQSHCIHIGGSADRRKLIGTLNAAHRSRLQNPLGGNP